MMNESKPMIKDKDSSMNDVSNPNESIDHILMTYESKNDGKSALVLPPEEPSIINNINNFSHNHHSQSR